jgi:transcription antitermination protein NusB
VTSELSPHPAQRRAPGHRRRRAARRTAIDILFQADVTERPPSTVLSEWRAAGRDVPAYAELLVTGVEGDMAAIDRVLGEHAEEWTVARMAAVDRTILRVACREMSSGIPAAVAINEAVEAANELSTEDSGRFVNGVLGRVARGPKGQEE